jgi:glycosyltransferase involved in cell wall biosynthesis
MRFSPITACFDSAATLGDKLRSVSEQSQPQIEHILIHGGSRDATAAVMHAHGNHVAHFVSEPDRGVYDAMNKRLALAGGKFVGFLNADDLYASRGSVAAMSAAVAAGGTDVDAVYGALVCVRESDTQVVVRRWGSGPFAPAACVEAACHRTPRFAHGAVCWAASAASKPPCASRLSTTRCWAA